MAKYVQGAGADSWHWCRNCTQWPDNIARQQDERPETDLCNQCEAKERHDECRAS
jgi:hypothetical protein